MKEINITPKEICKAIDELLNENERLKQNKKLYETFFDSDIDVRKQLIKRIDDYKNRIERAIKFIEENKRDIELGEYLLCDCLYDKKTIELIEILKGSGKE